MLPSARYSLLKATWKRQNSYQLQALHSNTVGVRIACWLLLVSLAAAKATSEPNEHCTCAWSKIGIPPPMDPRSGSRSACAARGAYAGSHTHPGRTIRAVSTGRHGASAAADITAHPRRHQLTIVGQSHGLPLQEAQLNCPVAHGADVQHRLSVPRSRLCKGPGRARQLSLRLAEARAPRQSPVLDPLLPRREMHEEHGHAVDGQS
eukprot:1952477-Rhodomonas_salina.1